MRIKELKTNFKEAMIEAAKADHNNSPINFYQTKRANGITLYQLQNKEKDDKLHHYRKSAWTEEQHNNSHEKEYEAETLKPTRYQFPKGSYAQWQPTILEKFPLKKDEYGEDIHTVSYLKPYIHGDHAWTGDFYDVAAFEAETEAESDYLKFTYLA